MNRATRWLTACLAGGLLCAGAAYAQGASGGGLAGGTAPAGSFRAPGPIRLGQPVSVLVFPFGYDDAADPAAEPATGPAAERLAQTRRLIANSVTAAVKAGFLATPAYTIVTYHPQAAMVQRALRDDVLETTHLTDLFAPGGATDVDKARVVAYRLGIQSFLVGTLDLKMDAATNTVELTVDTRLVDSTTGEVIRTAAVSGAAAGAEGVPISAVQDRASDEAAKKILPAMGITLIPMPEEPVKAGKGTPSGGRGSVVREGRRGNGDGKKPERRRGSVEREGDPKPSDPKDQKDEVLPAATVQPPAGGAGAAPAVVSGERDSRGYATATGQPIPFGYARDDPRSSGISDDRRRIRVPSWVWLGAFLTGLSFLM